MADPAFPDWRAPESAPTNGDPFLAELSGGGVAILHATAAVRLGHRFAWWGGEGNRVPHEPSHRAGATFEGFPRLTGWMPLPRTRHEAP